jgi:hypothetical protein
MSWKEGKELRSLSNTLVKVHLVKVLKEMRKLAGKRNVRAKPYIGPGAMKLCYRLFGFEPADVLLSRTSLCIVTYYHITNMDN